MPEFKSAERILEDRECKMNGVLLRPPFLAVLKTYVTCSFLGHMVDTGHYS